MENQEIKQESREQWTKSGRESLEVMQMPENLKDDIRQSLETPQYGPYHNEGPTLAAHIGKILETVNQIHQTKFDFRSLGLPPGQEGSISRLVTQTVQENNANMQLYAYLHDLKKPDCMNIEIQYEEDGKKKKKQEIFTMDQYNELTKDCVGDVKY